MMSGPYSVDLRECVLADCEAGLSRAAAALPPRRAHRLPLAARGAPRGPAGGQAARRRAAARTVEALEAALAPALAGITAADARGFFRACGYATPCQLMRNPLQADEAMTRKRLLRLVVLLLVAVIAAGGVWAFLLRPVGVQVVEAERDVPIQVFGLGTVEAQILSQVGFEVAGTLIELHADYGDRVAAGTLLARLDSREQEARVAQARAAVAQAESAIRQATASIERAQANLTQKAQANERRQELVRRGNVSIEAAQDAQSAYEMARAELAQAQSALEVARANLEQAKAEAAFEEVRLAKYALYAPYDAIVVSRNRELGAMLSPGEQLFTLVDPTTVWVLAYVDEAKAGRLQVGQRAEVTLRSLADRRFSGRIVRIDIESDRVNEERRVYIGCDDCPADFHLGEQAEVAITVSELAEARLVPQIAVIGLEGRHGVVWTVENGHLAQRAVMFGQRTLDGRLEIVDGLPPGAEVVVRPDAALRVGRAVTVNSAGGQP